MTAIYIREGENILYKLWIFLAPFMWSLFDLRSTLPWVMSGRPHLVLHCGPYITPLEVIMTLFASGTTLMMARCRAFLRLLFHLCADTIIAVGHHFHF